MGSLDLQLWTRIGAMKPERLSGTGFKPVSTGILPAEGSGLEAPGDRLEACPTISGSWEGGTPLFAPCKKTGMRLLPS